MINHLSSGLLTPVLSFGLSFVGCAVGLSSTARSRLYDGRARRLWLWMGALSIGGVGIWVMHFVAMLGFTVSTGEIRYDLPLTLVSLLLAVVVVAAGLFLVDRGAGRPVALLAGGGLTGVGVASMHYLGMRAVDTAVPIAYDPWLVALSVVIGVLAATAALWLTWTVRSALGGIFAAAVMALAVSGMHYTGMAAMQVAGAAMHDDHGTAGSGDGLTAEELVAPLVVVLTVSMLALVTVAILARAPREIRA
ncbi:MHYT domain-containing protein, partial [Marinobacter sp. M1N3S26]|uniref:MHYT domain-containing protein n=1 Tax=Marinobacter sp. M1N3S26 TaxID=3382299 RepID=UPI00387B4EA9